MIPPPVVQVSEQLKAKLLASADSVSDPITEIEYSFQSYQGVRYRLQFTADLVNYDPPVLDLIGDGTMKSYVLVIDKTRPLKAHRLVQTLSDGDQPVVYGIAAWNGSYVRLEWDLICQPESPTAHFIVKRDGVTKLNVPFAQRNAYIDSSPLAGTHSYSVEFYA
jgi:hypothetical protein